jgi:hypothetical protein
MKKYSICLKNSNEFISIKNFNTLIEAENFFIAQKRLTREDFFKIFEVKLIK